MNTPNTSRRSFLGLALLALVCLQAPMAHAQPQKNRGHIQSIDLENKTMVLDKTKGAQTLAFDDTVRVKSPAGKKVSDLKPGMYVLCFMQEDGKLIATIRHNPEQDKPAEEQK